MSIKGDWPRRRLTSREEADFRDDYNESEKKMPLREFRKRIAEIRKRTGKP